MAKVLVINSSPRKNSNTRRLAAKAAEGAARAGHSVKTIEIGRESIHPCVGCETCHEKTPGKCVFDDAMTKFYPEVLSADIILFSSPVYYFTINSQAKLFIDRTYALGLEGFGGKRIGGIFAFGGDDAVDSGCVNAIRMFQDICSYVNAKWIGAVYGSLWKEGTADKNPDLLKMAEEFGVKLAEL